MLFRSTRPIASFLEATGELLENCVVYARIILLALPCYVLQVMFQSFFVAAEKPNLGLTVTISSGVTNMVLDAVLVILLPQQHKLAGAAAATAMSQVVGAWFRCSTFSERTTASSGWERPDMTAER